MDMTSSNGKNEAARSEHVASAMPRMACTIAGRIAQCKGPFMPPVSKSVPRRPLKAKCGSHLEKLAIIKSNEMNYVAKVAPRPTSSATKTDSPAGKERLLAWAAVRKSTKPASREADEICVLLEQICLETWTFMPSLLMVLERFVCLSSFAKHTTQYRMTDLLAMMQI